MAKKPKLRTVTLYHRWQAGSLGLKAGAVMAPLVPASIVTAINWDEWFANTSMTLPFGFASLMSATIIGVVSVIFSGEIVKRKDIILLILAGIFACLGIADLFLAKLIYKMGLMMIYTACGLVGSFGLILWDKIGVQPVVAQYKQLVDQNYLVKKSQKKKLREEQARMDSNQVKW